jgi:ATP-dependent Clp protease ATP-binding subunit ClpB
LIAEPSIQDAIAILRGIKEKYEVHHGVRITDDALVAAAELSVRHLPDRFLPDKAIDLIDEATSAIRLEIDSLPSELDKLKRKIAQLQIEAQALKKDSKAKEKHQQIKKQIADLQEQEDKLQIQWRSEKELIDQINSTKAEIDNLKSKAEKLEREGEFSRVAEIIHGRLPEKQQELVKLTEKVKAKSSESTLLRQEVTEEDIAQIVSRWTGIPVAKMLKSETEKLAKMEQELAKRIIGQTEAVKAVANAVRRNRAGIGDEDRPIGNFLFLGPTGVGKTELTKSLAEFLFADEKAIVRLDMSEYMERHAVAKLIGSPPGYVGYEEGGQLTEKIRRRPFAIILLDEIEKAHNDVYNILLQIMDEGRLTDAKGRTVNFKNTLLVMTSNIGSELILSKEGIEPLALELKLKEKLATVFKPEFLNRLDEIITFKELTREQITQIVELQLDKLVKRLKSKNLDLEVTKEAKELIAEKGYDPNFGARPLKRVIQTKLENELALRLVKGELDSGSRVKVSTQNGELDFAVKKKG